MSEHPTRPDSFFDVLDQDELWWTADGTAMRLEEMGPRHKRNTLAFIQRQEPILTLTLGAHVAATAAPIAAEMVLGDLGRDGWINEFPLLQRLSQLIAEDQATGAPDEPDERVGKPLPCANWCSLCADQGPITVPGAPLPCSSCHDCNLALAAADDATWDRP